MLYPLPNCIGVGAVVDWIEESKKLYEQSLPSDRSEAEKEARLKVFEHTLSLLDNHSAEKDRLDIHSTNLAFAILGKAAVASSVGEIDFSNIKLESSDPVDLSVGPLRGVSLQFENVDWNKAELNLRRSTVGHLRIENGLPEKLVGDNARFASIRLLTPESTTADQKNYVAPKNVLSISLNNAQVEQYFQVFCKLGNENIAGKFDLTARQATFDRDVTLRANFDSQGSSIRVLAWHSSFSGNVRLSSAGQTSNPKTMLSMNDCVVHENLDLRNLDFSSPASPSWQHYDTGNAVEGSNPLDLYLFKVRRIVFDQMETKHIETTGLSPDDRCLTGLHVDHAVKLSGTADDNNKFWDNFVGRSQKDPIAVRRTLAAAIASGGDLAASEHQLTQLRKAELNRDYENLFGIERAKGVRLWLFITIMALTIVPVVSWHYNLTFQEYPVAIDIIVPLALAAGLLFFLRHRIIAKDSDGKQIPETEALALLFRTMVQKFARGGTRPLTAFGWIVGSWIVGAAVYSCAAYFGTMVPVQPIVYMQEGNVWSRGNARQSKESRDQWYWSTTKACLSGRKEDDTLLATRTLTALPQTSIIGICRKNWARPDLIGMESELIAETIAALDHIDAMKAENYKLSRQQERLEKLKSSNTDMVSLGDANYLKNVDVDAACMCRRYLPAEYSEFSPVIYSLDVTFPLVNLRQETEWAARTATSQQSKLEWAAGVFTVIFQAAQVVLGWMLLVIIAGSVSSLADPNRRP